MLVVIFVLVIIYAMLTLVSKYSSVTSTAAINNWLSNYCTDNAVLNVDNFAWSQQLRDNYTVIRDEFLLYTHAHTVPTFKQLNPGTNLHVDTDNWQTLYLRAYNKDTDIMSHFPHTQALLSNVPCTMAFFSILPPRATIDLHTGIYKGVVRYHLGLIVPDDYENCYINVNGTRLIWREGTDIMFDDTFPHYVKNNTDQSRVILFLDIQRDFNNAFVNGVNTGLLYFVQSNDVVNTIVQNANVYNS